MTHEAKDHDRAIGARDGRTADEVIASIDSSGWAVDPVAHGMTAMEYERGEAEMLMSAFQQRAGGVNTFFHFPGLTRFGDQWVVSVNNDTVYSVAVIDTRAGFSIEVPDMGDRFVSLHIQDFNHTFVDYSWTSGTHRYAAGDVDTDYVLAGFRIATTGTAEDAETWTYAVAGQFGLSPDDTAMYPPFAPAATQGDVTYRAAFDPVPAHAFFSLTVYSADRFLMSDDHVIVSSNRPDFVSRPDGGFDIVFGGAQARELAASEGANYLYTPQDGWNGILRAYRPDVDQMRRYRMPQLERVDK